MMYILDEKDNPVHCDDIAEWVKWFKNNTHRRILSRTYITPKIHISTIFLAVDYGSLAPGYGPVLWETMVFGDAGDLESGCERYETREEAIKGHLRWIDRVRAAYDSQ